MITYDRDTFFTYVRDSLFEGSLTQEQVDGQNAILAVWEYQSLRTAGMTDVRWLAYMLATTFHETATRMWPIEEYGKGEGHDYGKTDPETGQAYYGRGFVQLTWRDNYAKATEALGLEAERDIEYHAEMALDAVIATRVMFQGMAEGWFTGKELDDYFTADKDDPINARQIINGNDKDDLIASYHEAYLDALHAAKQDVQAPSKPAASVPTVTVTIEGDAPTKVNILLGANVEIGGGG